MKLVRALQRLAVLTLGPWGLACGSDVDPGTVVEISAAPGSLQPDAALPSATGQSVRVRALHWATAELELVRCASAWQRLYDAAIPSAHAHGESSPTLSAVPSVQDALGTGELMLAELAPPAGQYCALRQHFGPADADAVGLESAPAMLGNAYALSATLEGPDGSRSLEVVSQQSFDVTLAIDLTLSAEHTSARLLLSQDPERWFGDVDFSTLSGRALEEALLAAFRASSRVQLTWQ